MIVHLPFPWLGTIWFCSVLVVGWRAAPLGIMYLCPNCDDLHEFTGFPE